MLKAMLIKWLVEEVIDLALQGLKTMSAESDNDIDDQLVVTLASNRTALVEKIKQRI